MKKYTVTFSYSIDVEAKNKEEAKKLASEHWDNRTAPYAEEVNLSIDERKIKWKNYMKTKMVTT